MRSTFYSVTIFVVFMSLLACEDPNNPNETGNSPTLSAEARILTGGAARTWQLKSRTIGNTTRPVSECEADNRYTYRTDSSCVFDYGANRCADEQNSVSGKWAILNRGVYLEVNYNKTSILYEVVKLSDTLMVLTWNGSQGKYTDSYQPTTIAKTQKSGKFVL